MEINTDKKFRDHYGLLLENFKQKLYDNSLYPEKLSENLPYPFIPDYGKFYEESKFKFAFVGQDSKYDYCSGLKEFLSNTDPLKYSDILNYDLNDSESYPEFIDYTKGNSFWKFVLKFLSMFYSIDNWEDLKNNWGSDSNTKILGSFVHGNVNSIPNSPPDFNRSKGLNTELWEKIKNASKIFDNSSHIIQAFKPNVVFLFYWHAPEEWLPNARTEFEKFDPINLWYCFAKETNTHFYWTYHPSAMRNNDSDEILSAIFNSIREKKLFDSLPK